MAQTQLQPRRSSRPWLKIGGWGLNCILIVLGLLMLAPFAWLFVNSFLPQTYSLTLPPKWWPEPFTLHNYQQVFSLIPFGLLVLNSVEITGIVTIGALITSSLAAYALARLDFPGRNI